MITLWQYHTPCTTHHVCSMQLAWWHYDGNTSTPYHTPYTTHISWSVWRQGDSIINFQDSGGTATAASIHMKMGLVGIGVRATASTTSKKVLRKLSSEWQLLGHQKRVLRMLASDPHRGMWRKRGWKNLFTWIRWRCVPETLACSLNVERTWPQDFLPALLKISSLRGQKDKKSFDTQRGSNQGSRP